MKIVVARVALLLLLVAWSARFAFSDADGVTGSFPHVVNLVFHEAGHVLFSPFGAFLTLLGGSLMQVIVPVVCAVALATQAHDRFGAAVAGWWAGQNFVDLAPYIGDARALRLPLLGGATGAEVDGHDWEAILSALGWLHHDHSLAAAAHGLGVAIMMGAIGYAAWTLVQPGAPASRADAGPAPADR
jgi:hypothetical protein